MLCYRETGGGTPATENTMERINPTFKRETLSEIVKESFVDELEGCYFELTGHYPEEVVES